MIDPIAKGYESQIVEYVNQRVKDLRDARQGREIKWLECMDAYLCQQNSAWAARARAEGRSARFLPLVWDATENITAQLIGMLFPNEEWFKVDPARRGGFMMSDDMDSPVLEVLLRAQHSQMKFAPEFKKLLKWLVITGNCPWSMDWHTESAVNYPSYQKAMAEYVQAQIEDQQLHEQAMMQAQAQAQAMMAQGMQPPPPPQLPPPMEPPLPDMDLMYEGPRLTVGDPFNFVIDDQANDPISAFRANTTWRTKAYLQSMAEADETGYSVYENIDELQDSNRYGDDNHNSRNQQLAQAFGINRPEKDAIKLVSSVGDFEMVLGREDGEKGYLNSWQCVIGNDNTLLKFEPNHLWSKESHLQLATLIPVPGQVYGLGLVENALGLNDSVQVRHNQILDAAAVAINPETKAIDDGVFDPEEIESGPGAVHMVGTMDNLQPIQKNLQGLNLAFSEISMLQGFMEQMFRSSGQSNPKTKSATEVARDTSVIGASLQEIARSLEDTCLIPILKLQLQYNQQYMSEEVMVRITQQGTQNWGKVNPEIIQRAWDFKVVGSANQMLKEKRLQDLLMFFQLVSGNPATAMQVDLNYLMRRVYEEMGFVDGDKAFFPPGFNPMQQPGGGPGGGQQAQGGGGGLPADQGFPGVGTPDQAAPGVQDISQYTQAAQYGLMGGGESV